MVCLRTLPTFLRSPSPNSSREGGIAMNGRNLISRLVLGYGARRSTPRDGKGSDQNAMNNPRQLSNSATSLVGRTPTFTNSRLGIRLLLLCIGDIFSVPCGSHFVAILSCRHRFLGSDSSSSSSSRSKSYLFMKREATSVVSTETGKRMTHLLDGSMLGDTLAMRGDIKRVSYHKLRHSYQHDIENGF